MPLACLTLLVPELLWPEPEDREVWDGLDCPALSMLFARGRLSRTTRQSAEEALAELFGQAGAAAGAFRLLGEADVPADAATARWIAADPVHLRLDQERLILAGAAALAITEEEAAAIVGELNSYFTDLGTFHAASAERWYLRLADGESGRALQRLDAPAPSAVTGRSVELLLQEITEDRAVRKLLNEIQTVLHAHPVNRRREEDGLAPINSLWLWGTGASSQSPTAADFDGVWSADPLARGLARAAGVPAHPLPDGIGALLDAAAAGTRPLIVLADLAGPVHYENGADYRQALSALEARWFAPAWRALAAGAFGRLRLIAPTAYGTLAWDTARAARWRFWRRPQALADTAKALAGTSPASAGEAA